MQDGRARSLLNASTAAVPQTASELRVTAMQPTSPNPPATSGEPGSAPGSQPDSARPLPASDGSAPVKPSDASDNTQGNEVHDEDLEPTDATDEDNDPDSAGRQS